MKKRLKIGWVVLLGASMGWGLAAESAPDDMDARARMVDRYTAILMERPRKGAALRSLYKLQVEALAVDAWLDGVEAQAEADPNDPRRWLLAGLVLQAHGNEERARPYFERAAELDDSDWYAPYCLGEMALYANRYEAAVRRLEDAAQRTRERENLVVIYSALGRAFLRSGRPEDAEHTFDRVAQLGPDDVQTIEELAGLLFEEDHAEAAARLYARLCDREGLSPYQRVHYTMRLARMKAEVGEPDEALALYQEALARVSPDSWLYEEIYAHIESLYREGDRLDELIELYRASLRQRPQEVELALRLAESLSNSGDSAAAIEALKTALERAPSRLDLHRALADHYMRAERFAEAIAQLERLVRDQPEASDHRRQLARAWLRRTEAPDHLEQSRRWVLSLAEGQPETAETALRVAETLVELGFREDAVAWYRRASERAPEAGEYDEYLGEHLVQLGRRQEAFQAFAGLAAGPRRSASSLARLADVLAYHGFEDEALDALRDAIVLEPANFDVGSLYARHLDREGQVEEALRELDRIEAFAPNVYFRDDVINQRIQLLNRMEQLEAAYRDHLATFEPDGSASPEDWILAAKMALALRRRLDARDWIDRAVAERPRDLRILDVAEKVYRTVGDVEGQLNLLQRMAEVEPQRRIDLLKRMVATYQRLGDLDQAARTAQDLIDWVPSSPTGYQLMARLKAERGLPNEAFDYLRRAIRAAPGEISLRIELAGLLQSQLMIAEAIETYWQVMDVAEDVSEKLAVIKPLSELYHGQGRFDRLVDRLRRMKRSALDPLPASLALVAAYETVDDLAAARRELMDLAATRPADENVLRQLVGLSRREGDVSRAVAFQRKLVDLAPTRVHYRLLGDLLLERNDRDGALAAWQRGMERAAATRDTEVAQTFEWIEQLERNGFEEQAAAALGDLHRRHRDDWRVVYRVAVAHANAGDMSAAFPLLREIVEMPSSWAVDRETEDEPAQEEMMPWSNRFPWPHLLLQEVVSARQVFAAGGGGTAAGANPVGQPLDLDRAQAYALALIGRMEGQLDAVDPWLDSLRQGGRHDRRLLLEFALIIHDTEFTRAVSREILADYPDDAFARLVSMTPSRAQAQHGVEDAFLATVREHLAWFKDHQPDYEWFYDWHELRVLILHGDDEQIRTVAHRLVDRGQSDPFVLAQSMNLLHRARLYDIFESCIDGALAYYEERGAASIQQQLLNSLGYIAIDILREDPVHLPRALRVFSKYLDASRPSEHGRLPSSATLAWGTSGTVRQQLTLPYPQPNPWWDSAQQSLLQRLVASASNAGQEAAVIRHFEHRVDVAEGEARTHARLALARVYWWAGRPEDTRDVLRDALRDSAEDDALRLELARLEQELGNVQAALDLARTLSPPYGVIFREVQQWMLQLALDAGDEQAARAPAERLLRMRLSSEEMLDLADQLTTLGETDEAVRLVQRAERMQQAAGGYGRGGGLGGAGLEQRLERLRMHERKGNAEQARLLAQQILRACRTAAPPQADRFRGEALGVLRRLGELEPLVAEVKARLKEQPGSLRWIDELFWYYRADGRDDAALALLERPLDNLQGVEDFRLRVARLFFEERKFAAAADQLALVLTRDPSVFFGVSANYWLLNQAFAEAGRADELVAAFERMEPEDLLGSRRLLHANRTQMVAHLINFARDALQQEGIPAELTLRVCRLTPPLLSTRQMRETYLPQIYDLTGLAYDTVDQPADAFASLLGCIAPPAVLEHLGMEAGAAVWPQSLQSVSWAKAAPGSMLLRCLHAGRKAGRMADLEAACRAVADRDQPGTRFLLFASILFQGRIAEAMSRIDAAIEDGARVGGRPRQDLFMLVYRVTAAQLLRDMDAPDQAARVWESALASPALDRWAGVEESIVNYFVQTCVQAGRTDQARTYLMTARTPEREGMAMAMTSQRGDLGRIVSSAEHLYELGYSLDALRMSQRVSRFRRGRSDEQLVRRAEAVVKKIREDRLPVLRDSEAMDAMISQLEAEPVSLEAGSGAWESLLWLYQAKGETNRAAAVRAAARAVGRDDPEWRHRLAVASRDAGQFNEAVDDYLAVVRADPGRFVASREEFQSAAECVRRAGRMKELTEAFRETDFRAWLTRSTTGAGSSAAIGNLAQLARHAMNRGVNAPELSLVLARRLREAVCGRSAYAAHDQSLAETMERAIREMDLAAEERFIEQLELVASPAMMRVIAADREPTRMSPVWVLGMQWRERNVQGLLTQILDQAERSGRLRSLQAAAEIAIEAGEVDKHYLRCLFSLRLDPAAVDEALVHQAVAAASGYRDRPDRRAFLLCILGQELVRGNRPGDAVGVYEKAVLLAQQSAQDATALSASFYLAITHLADGRPEDAQRVLLEPPVARWSSNRPDHINDQRSAAMLMQARKLRILGFYAAAWRRAAEVQALYAAQPGHRRYTDAEEFLQGLLSQDLPRTQDGGEWEALLGDLRAQQERSPGDARLLHQIYRLGEALGREQVAAEALHRLAALEPDDSDVHHLLAQVYFKAGDMEQAYVHLQALLRIEPSRVFAGQADQRMAVEVSQRVGKIPDLVSAVCETAGPRMLGPAQDPSDVERVGMGLLSVASAIQSAPVQSPEDAARILEYVWSTLPGESRLDSLEKRIYHRLVAVHRAMDRPADEFRARIRFTAGSAVARELGFGTRQSMPPDFRAELGWSEAGAPDSAMVRMIEVAGRAGQLEALLGACRRVRNGRPLPPHQLLETLVLLALKRPDDLALTLPRLAELLDRMGFEAAHRLLVQSQIAEGYRQAGDPRTAQYLLRDAWELARAGGRTADESNLVFLLAEALRADERESEAVDLVLRHDPSGGQGEDDEAGASQRLEYAQRAVPYLLGIGHAAAALRKTRREVAWATEHAPVSLRPEFTALRHDAIHRGLPALRQAQPDRFEAELERLHRAVEQGHDEAALEDLYFMLVEAGDVDRLRAVEDRIRGEQPDNGAALMEMARRAWKNGEVERAAGLFEEILYLDPILPFRQGSDYRELVGALAGADRLSVLVEAVEAGFDTVLGSGSTVDDPTRKQVVQRMIDASRRLLVPDLDAATEAKALAEAARRACGRDPAWTAYRDAAEASIRKAITQLSEGEDAYRAFLPWVITPAIANRLGVSGPLEVAAWTADWRWHESTIRCFLDSFLRVLTATGHGPAFVDACLEARGSGDHSAMYLAALILLREGSASTDLEDAVKSGRAAAMDPSRTAAERMHLLGLLGNELLRAGRLDDAIACFQDAVAAGPESEPEAGLTYLMLYLSEAFEKTGDIEQAEALLITSPWSAEAETRLAGRYADVLLQHHYRVAKRLASMGRIEPADAMLRRLLAIEKGSTRQYYHKKARGLLESL